jgi:hypothetical protein
VVALGVAGLVVSWLFFARWIGAHGLDAGRFWSQALWSGESAGLVWDLVASAGIVTALSIRWRRALGGAGIVAVLLTTWILGVCGGLALLVVLAKPRSSARRGALSY